MAVTGQATRALMNGDKIRRIEGTEEQAMQHTTREWQQLEADRKSTRLNSSHV